MSETDNLTAEGLYAIISGSRYRDVGLLAPPEFIAAVHELALRMDLGTPPFIVPQSPNPYVWGQPVTVVYDGTENVKFVDGHWELVGVVCVRDNQGRVWRLSSDGFWRHDPLGFGRDWAALLHYHGPVHEVR